MQRVQAVSTGGACCSLLIRLSSLWRQNNSIPRQCQRKLVLDVVPANWQPSVWFVAVTATCFWPCRKLATRHCAFRFLFCQGVWTTHGIGCQLRVFWYMCVFWEFHLPQASSSVGARLYRWADALAMKGHFGICISGSQISTNDLTNFVIKLIPTKKLNTFYLVRAAPGREFHLDTDSYWWQKGSIGSTFCVTDID